MGKKEMDLLQTSTWKDIEDIQEDVNQYLHCDDIICHISRECIYFTYNPDRMPSNRDIIGLIHYVIGDLGGKLVVDKYKEYVRIRFRVKTG